MIVLEKRQHPSLWMGYLSPLLSIALTFVVAAMVVGAMGKDPLRVLSLFYTRAFEWEACHRRGDAQSDTTHSM